MKNKEAVWSLWKLRSNFKGVFWEYDQQKAAEAVISTAEMQAAFRYHKNDNPNSADLVYRFLQKENWQPSPSEDAIYKGIHYYQSLQMADGKWPGDFGGPMFLLPGFIFIAYLSNRPFDEAYRSAFIQYMLNHQNSDGGWGLHLEGHSTMFGTVMQYVALRLLGMPTSHEAMQQAQQWIQAHGGAVKIPSWGKFYLCVLGLMEWECCNSLLPELWLLPKWIPFHPWRYWCHARMVYLPMAYCFGQKVKMPSNNLIDEIKKEIYTEKYDQIIWENYKNACGKEDLYFPPSKFQLFVNKLLNFYEKNHIKSWRKKALAFCYDYILAEDEQTFSVNIGPVNQVLNAIAIWHTEGADSQNFEAHVDSWKNYCWLAEDGMKVQGYNGSFLWDTSFAYQAIAEAGLKAEFAPTLSRAFSFIKANRIAEDCDNSEKYFRHARKGAWAFSNLAQGWAVTDCTAEALRCALHYQKWHPNNPVTDCPTPLSEKEIFESIDLLLSFQNSNGGWASYELKRAPSWIEFLNPSEIFGDIMTEVTYVECSSATMQTLMQFQHIFPNYKTKQITTAIEKGMDFILKKQREDGSWYGSWAVCFTYGAWFALEAISHYLKNYAIATDKKKQLKAALEKGEAFLWSKQNEDGGWGENFESCVQKKWINAPSQIINTAWAVLGLLAMDSTNKTGLAKAIALIESRQMPNGDFPQEQISGVFNHNCMETYTAYRNVFPIWALARYRHKK